MAVIRPKHKSRYDELCTMLWRVATKRQDNTARLSHITQESCYFVLEGPLEHLK